MTDEKTLGFIQRHIKSVWALELLLLFHNDPDREWHREGLVKELRGSEAVVRDAVDQLKLARLVQENPGRLIRYAPADPSLREMVSQIAVMYSTHPVVVIKAISVSPTDRAKIFSDAFKIRDT